MNFSLRNLPGQVTKRTTWNPHGTLHQEIEHVGIKSQLRHWAMGPWILPSRARLRHNLGGLRKGLSDSGWPDLTLSSLTISPSPLKKGTTFSAGPETGIPAIHVRNLVRLQVLQCKANLNYSKYPAPLNWTVIHASRSETMHQINKHEYGRVE